MTESDWTDLDRVVQPCPLRRLVLNVAAQLGVVAGKFELSCDVEAVGLSVTRQQALLVPVHLAAPHGPPGPGPVPVLKLPLLHQHLSPSESCVEYSHLLLIIEDANTEQTERDEDTDEDNDEDDSTLLAVEIY